LDKPTKTILRSWHSSMQRKLNTRPSWLLLIHETTWKHQTKWKHIAKLTMANVNVEHHGNGSPTYKDKWGSLYGEYKKIHDYMNSISHHKNIGKCLQKTRLHKTCPNIFTKFTWIQMMICIAHHLTMIICHVMTLSSLKKWIVNRPLKEMHQNCLLVMIQSYIMKKYLKEGRTKQCIPIFTQLGRVCKVNKWIYLPL